MTCSYRGMVALMLLVGGSFLAAGNGARAQGFDFATPSGSKAAASEIQIYADDGLEWQSDQTKVIAHGNAKAVRGDMTVTADELTAYYRNANGQTGGGQTAPAAPAKKTTPPPTTGTTAPDQSSSPMGGSQIWRLDADGHVTLSSPTDIATGDKAIYDLDKGVMVLKGKPARLVTPSESYSADDQLEYWEQEHMAVLRGNAVATGKDKKIQADVLTAHFKDRKTQAAHPKPVPNGNGKKASSGTGGGMELSHADAYGHVIVTTTDDVVTGDRGDYNAETGIVTITGKVQITRGTNVLNGGYAHVDMNTGISTLFGNPAGDPNGKARAEGTFVPTPKNGPASKNGSASQNGPASQNGGEQRTPLFRGQAAAKTPAANDANSNNPDSNPAGTQQ